MRLLTVGVALFALGIAQSSGVAQTTRAAADPSTPKGALKALATAMTDGDADALHSLLLTSSATEQRMVGVMSDMAVAIAELNRAMITRFGRAQAAVVLGGDPDEMLTKSLANIDGAVEKIDGDTATVSTTGQDSFTLKKSGNRWGVAVSEMSKGATAQQVEEKAAVLATQMRAMHEVTNAITAGKYATATEAATALHAKMGGPPPSGTSTAPAK